MSDNVLHFNKEAEKREALVWKCDCGNCSFYIYDNGALECASCNVFVDGVNEHYQTVRKWTRKLDDE